MELTPELLLSAYAQGIFPMADDDGGIFWYDPDPRAILPLNGFHVPRSLQRVLRRGDYVIRLNYDFDAVIRACAAPAEGRESTWISEEIITAYKRLHRLGFAHCVESWYRGEMVGGLYGVSLGGLFAGESMFSRKRDASKVALSYLIAHLRKQGFILLDIQILTDHLQQFGAIEMTQRQYKKLLAVALKQPAVF